MLIIHRNSQIFTWARLGWCPVGSTSWVIPSMGRAELCTGEQTQPYTGCDWRRWGEGKAPASSTNPAVEFMNPKYTTLEAGEGIRILVMLGHDLFRLWKPRDNQRTGVCVTSRPVTSRTWSLFTSAIEWLPWLHLHIHSTTEIYSQRPLLGAVEEEDALPVIMLGSCKKSGCVNLKRVCALHSPLQV